MQEIPVTTDRFLPSNYVTKLMRNKVYQIPDLLIPQTKTYEIEVCCELFQEENDYFYLIRLCFGVYVNVVV